MSLRRPDVIIETDSKYLLVEVKRTNNMNYIVDSIYKVFGYLSDFEKQFEPFQKPKAILVVWKQIKHVEKSDHEVIILSHTNIGDIKEIVANI